MFVFWSFPSSVSFRSIGSSGRLPDSGSVRPLPGSNSSSIRRMVSSSRSFRSADRLCSGWSMPSNPSPAWPFISGLPPASIRCLASSEEASIFCPSRSCSIWVPLPPFPSCMVPEPVWPSELRLPLWFWFTNACISSFWSFMFWFCRWLWRMLWTAPATPRTPCMAAITFPDMEESPASTPVIFSITLAPSITQNATNNKINDRDTPSPIPLPLCEFRYSINKKNPFKVRAVKHKA